MGIRRPDKWKSACLDVATLLARRSHHTICLQLYRETQADDAKPSTKTDMHRCILLLSLCIELRSRTVNVKQ